MGDHFGSHRVAPIIFNFFQSISLCLLLEKSKRLWGGGSRKVIRNEKKITRNGRKSEKIRTFQNGREGEEGDVM